MKNLNKFQILTLTFTVLFASFSFSQSPMQTTKADVVQTTESSVVSYLTSSSDHTILVKALTAAGLVETLSGDGPFTVFAPTNDAFKALPKGTLEMLLEPGNKEKLKTILTYHVLSGSFNSTTIVRAIEKNEGQASFATLNGNSFDGFVENSELIITSSSGNDSKVLKADLSQKNGIIHIIDGVILPE